MQKIEIMYFVGFPKANPIAKITVVVLLVVTTATFELVKNRIFTFSWSQGGILTHNELFLTQK